jgi:hypothetical protein
MAGRRANDLPPTFNGAILASEYAEWPGKNTRMVDD